MKSRIQRHLQERHGVSERTIRIILKEALPVIRFCLSQRNDLSRRPAFIHDLREAPFPAKQRRPLLSVIGVLVVNGRQQDFDFEKNCGGHRVA
jgi:hypothetical protein